MKFKSILFSVLCAGLTLSVNGQITKIEHIYENSPSHAGHDHGTGHFNPDDYPNLLKGFDEAAAMKEIKASGVHPDEWYGILTYKKNQYLVQNHPKVFVNKDKDKTPVPIKSGNCPNAGFENLAFQPQWTGGVSTYTAPYGNSNIVTNGINSAYDDPLSRHTILTSAPINNNPLNGAIVGYDPIAKNISTGIAEIPFVAPNGNGSSVRLGNANTGYEKERLRYVLNVTPNNRAFYYQFAVVLQNPSSHSLAQQPYFKISFLDTAGNLVGGNCGQYNILSSAAASDTSFKVAQAGTNAIYYRKWHRVDVDLTLYIGQQITVEFETADCNQGGHYGYAYIDAGCQESIETEVSYCAGDAYAELVAPAGFPTYQWYGPNSTTNAVPGATNDTLQVPAPNVNDTFYVKITTSNGCELFQTVIIDYSFLKIEDISLTKTCFGAGAGSVDITASGSNQGYLFDFQPINIQNTTGFLDSLYTGNYSVHITSPNPSCGTVDSVFFIDVAPVFPTSISAKFCEGVGAVSGPNSPVYQWYDNSQQPIAPPLGSQQTILDTTAYAGEKYYLKYQLPSGCFDTLIYTFVDNKVGSAPVLARPQGCRSIFVTFNDLTPNTDTLTFSINGPNGYSYVYFDTLFSNFQDQDLDTGLYYVRFIDEGCFYDTTFRVVDVISNQDFSYIFCPEDQFFLSSLAVGDHSWTDPLGTVLGTTQNITVGNIIEGDYIDSCAVLPGCYALTTYFMDSITMVTSYDVIDNVCNGGSEGSIDMQYLDGPTGPTVWTSVDEDGNSTVGNPFLNLEAGVYIVQTKVLNCTHYDTITVTEPELSGDTLTIYTQICDELDSTNLYAPDGFTNYQWYYQGNPIQNGGNYYLPIEYPTELTNYTVTFSAPPLGCKKKTIKFDTEPFHYDFKPDVLNNVFTPNADDVNAIYHPFHDAVWAPEDIAFVTRDYRMTVYNRWGNKIWETTEYSKGWDGQTFKGNPVDDGVYFVEVRYVMKCEAEDAIQKFVERVQVVR